MALLMIRHLKRKKSRLTKKQQVLFIHLLADLLANGFTVQESLLFMKKSRSIEVPVIDYLSQYLVQGETLSDGLCAVGFKETIVIQIEFAQTHGDLSGTLEKIKQHLRIVNQQLQNLYKVLTYPALLLGFLMVVLISIRQILLPQLMTNGTVSKENLGITFIQNSPYYLVFVLIGIFIIIFATHYFFRSKSPLDKATFFSKIPFFGKIYKEYCSAFFALEWGKLFVQGLEIKSVIHLMKCSKKQSLMGELARSIEAKSILGQTFYEQLPSFTFFTPELSLIIQQGEVKGNLGKELILYSELCWQRFFKKIEKLIQWIQPIIFLIVAILVISIYAAMLLPIYSGMEEFL